MRPLAVHTVAACMYLCAYLYVPVLTCVYLCTYLCAHTGAATLERGDVAVGGSSDAASFCPYCGSLCLPVLTCTYLCAHTGAATLERGDVADAVNTEARQRLQDVVQRSHPAEKLRYSTLLLALHTLFGIHCGMLQTLFFRHGHRAAANIDELVHSALGAAETSTAADSDVME